MYIRSATIVRTLIQVGILPLASCFSAAIYDGILERLDDVIPLSLGVRCTRKTVQNWTWKKKGCGIKDLADFDGPFFH